MPTEGSSLIRGDDVALDANRYHHYPDRVDAGGTRREPIRTGTPRETSHKETTSMADRALRGMTIGAKSMESEDGVEFAERMIVSYECPMAHVTRIPMSTEAEVPPTWECPECGQLAARRGEDEPEPDEPKKTPRTHWDMLLERRKIDELEVLLNERLEALRSGEVYRERVSG